MKKSVFTTDIFTEKLGIKTYLIITAIFIGWITLQFIIGNISGWIYTLIIIWEVWNVRQTFKE